MFQKIIILLIKGYQKIISPLLGNRCRFYPSCSNYAIQSITKHGIIKGTKSSIRRILKCHPFNPGGYDPVD